MTQFTFNSGCHCIDVPVGSYRNQVTMKPPFKLLDCFGEKKPVQLVCVDTCLATEIGFLWNQGVVTNGCCCGHGALPPYIGVSEESVEKMRALGYEQFSSEQPPVRPEQHFVPKSIPR